MFILFMAVSKVVVGSKEKKNRIKTTTEEGGKEVGASSFVGFFLLYALLFRSLFSYLVLFLGSKFELHSIYTTTYSCWNGTFNTKNSVTLIQGQGVYQKTTSNHHQNSLHISEINLSWLSSES